MISSAADSATWPSFPCKRTCNEGMRPDLSSCSITGAIVLRLQPIRLAVSESLKPASLQAAIARARASSLLVALPVDAIWRAALQSGSSIGNAAKKSPCLATSSPMLTQASAIVVEVPIENDALCAKMLAISGFCSFHAPSPRALMNIRFRDADIATGCLDPVRELIQVVAYPLHAHLENIRYLSDRMIFQAPASD